MPLSIRTASADGAPPPPPDMALKASIEQVRGLIQLHYADYKATPQDFCQVINEVVAPRFDVDSIARLVLGVNYRTASPEQRQRFAAAFEDMLVRTYAGAMLDNYHSSKVSWMPPRLSADGLSAEVNTVLTRDDGQSFAVGFRVHWINGDWKVVDLSVENISLSINFRTQINSQIKRSSLDDVIHIMQGDRYTQGMSGRERGS